MEEGGRTVERSFVATGEGVEVGTTLGLELLLLCKSQLVGDDRSEGIEGRSVRVVVLAWMRERLQ